MSNPIKILGRINRLEGMLSRRDFQHGGATVDVGKSEDDRCRVNILDGHNNVIATIEARQMNGLVRRWMKATGWLYSNNKGGENFIRLKRLKKPEQKPEEQA